MKQIILSVLVGLSTVSAFAKEGGNGSHGGNTELSTKAQVKSAIHDATLYLPGLFWN
ncbi:MAG: hypothetical protein H7301_08345 [Cryobacterium sp.]|nr:hypothetical protein [Oligoflexia bacterium]